MCLLITPISDLVGLIKRHVGWFWNSGLWSFKVIKASFCASTSIRSSNLSFLDILAAFLLICLTVLLVDFLYVLVTFSVMSF
jgi:hypothetical protein